MLFICKQNFLMMMKGMMFGLFIISIIFASCVKNNSTGGGCSFQPSNVAVPDSQVRAIKDSIYTKGITNSIQDPAGFFYHIDSLGSGTTVTGLCSTVYVSYKASFFNGVAFDSTATNTVASFQLGQAIVGWQKALPLLSKGGVMTWRGSIHPRCSACRPMYSRIRSESSPARSTTWATAGRRCGNWRNATTP